MCLNSITCNVSLSPRRGHAHVVDPGVGRDHPIHVEPVPIETVFYRQSRIETHVQLAAVDGRDHGHEYFFLHPARPVVMNKNRVG